ncbi:PadR family transcriptional regulator (plasmid) [Natrinema zhouii]|nr:helix-turn-helix transcriptional regulator [Natrinema zhouii]UHQ98426.1 PadR family transcriptional regulator [Natrinema zhouii]
MSDESERYALSIDTQGDDDRDTKYVERDTPDVESEVDELIEQVTSALPIDDIQFHEATIKENLEEVLLMLITLHGETHGKQLLSDLTYFFDVQLSPGTVYPSLHNLEEEDLLNLHAMVRTKEYSIANEDEVCAIIEQTMIQHLAFGLLLYAFLPRLSSRA